MKKQHIKWIIATISSIMVFILIFMAIPEDIVAKYTKEYVSIRLGVNESPPEEIYYDWGWPINLIDGTDYIYVNQGNFSYWFGKGSIGYDIITYNGTPVVEQERFEIQRQQNQNQWRVIGDPISVTWEKISDYEYTITRNYDDYNGTTSNITYTIKDYDNTKITCQINSGADNNYRLAWLLDGIHQTATTETFTSCTFGNPQSDDNWIGIDWQDVLISFGDITDYTISDIAAGKKIQVYFNVGYATAGEVIALDPSINGKIKTDQEKLEAIYSLLEQNRDEYNRQLEIYKTDEVGYAEQWYVYAKRPKKYGGNVFHTLRESLLAEQNSIKNKIFADAGWNDESYGNLTLEEQDTVYAELYGDRDTLRDIPTIATSEGLTKLKGIILSDLTPDSPLDPYEDYTTYTEQDANNRYTITSTKIDISGLLRNEDAWVYKDYGAGYFNALDWTVETQASTGTISGGYAISGILGVSNEVDDLGGQATSTWHLFWYNTATYSIDLRRGNQAADSSVGLTLNKTYRLEVSHALNSNTVSCDIIDSTDESLDDTITFTNATIQNQSWQYVVAANSWNSATTQTFTGFNQNLDIGEGAAEPSISVSPSSKAFGTIKADYTNWSYGSEPSWPLTDGDAYFYIYNDGSSNCTVSVNATDPTGGTGATLVMGSPGSDEVRLSIFAEGDGSTDNITILDGILYTFLTDFAPSDNTSWEIKLETGTSSETVPTEKTFHIYFLAY